ncbi:MAG: SpaA isopeptide-forming pilin-related protein [Christensenellales bacterium]|nr:SpaA isopeptide-forming pilin-related protein [Christensenellales bacterium]
MQLRRKIKRLAALVLAMNMALGCMPVGAWAEATTPTDLPPIIATDGEAMPEPTLPSDEQEIEKEDDAPALEESEAPDESDGDSKPALDDSASEQEESVENNTDELPADEPQSDEEQEVPPDEPVAEEGPVEADEEEQIPDEETVPDDRLPIQAALDEHGHVYVATVHKASVYSDAAMTEESLVYTTTEDVFLVLATEFAAPASVKVWFLSETGEVICGYARADDLDSSYLLDEDIPQISFFPAGEGMTDIGLMPLFIVSGVQPTQDADTAPAETQEGPVSDEQQPDAKTLDDAVGLQPEPGELGDAAEQLPVTDMEEILSPEEAPDALVLAAPGDYVSVTTDTRVLEYVNEYAIEDDYCDGYLGQFVSGATVQVLSVTTDELGNGWYEVRFLYGDDFADGTMKWTDYATCWVMAAETGPAGCDACTVTDFAYSQEFLEALQAMDISLYSTPMNGFSLKNINGSIGGFYAWQSSLYGSSGRDSAYPQIAKSASHGTIYATPHYLEGFTVYCLEHTLSGPGEGSGSSQTAKGPYVLVDMDYFVNNSGGGGVSGVRFSAKTMHALAWVLRHTYPFMALNRSDSNNEVWSRVAGQFAMREVIKQLEGSQYVRSYWDMDNFYAFSGGAPAVYLTYARWLAENGIARASITGKITASNQSLSVSGSSYIGTVTLTTDADLIRIPRSVGTLTGNSGGSDGSYYYIKSGDTIRVTSSSSRFAVSMESISSDDEEANFLVGIPSVAIQKIMVPLYGSPYALQTASVSFELSTGEIKVTKKSSDGILLKGAVFELLSSAGSVLATKTTGSDGVVLFADLTPGTYTVREKSAPEGYALSAPSSSGVTVAAGTTTNVSFTNDRITGRIRVVKTDSLTGKPLAGAVFSVTRLTGPASDNAADIGRVVATVTTNAQGIAETGLLPWGQYSVTETGVPNGYLDAGYTTTVTIQ